MRRLNASNYDGKNDQALCVGHWRLLLLVLKKFVVFIARLGSKHSICGVPNTYFGVHYIESSYPNSNLMYIQTQSITPTKTNESKRKKQVTESRFPNKKKPIN